MKNKRGFTFMDVVVGLLITGMLVVVINRFGKYSTNHVINTQNERNIIIEINNKITEIYESNNWESLEDEIIEVGNATLNVRYDYEGKSKYNTDRIKIEFSSDDMRDKEYVLEKSAYTN